MLLSVRNLVLLLAGAGIFAAGVAVGHYRLQPFGIMQSIYTEARFLLGGQDTVAVKSWYTDTSGKTEADCPKQSLIVVALGQSNAANAIPHQSVADASVPAYSFFDGKCFVIDDPMPGTDNLMGSLWPLVSRDVVSLTGQPVVVVAGAASNSSIRQWTDDRYGLAGRVERQLELLRQASMAGKVVVVWLQGESDSASLSGKRYAAGVSSGKEYAQRTNMLFDRLSNAAKGIGPVKFVMTLTSVCHDAPNGSQALRDAQREVIDARQDTVLGADTDSLGAAVRYDGCHLSRAGLERLAPQLAVEIARAGAGP